MFLINIFRNKFQLIKLNKNKVSIIYIHHFRPSTVLEDDDEMKRCCLQDLRSRATLDVELASKSRRRRGHKIRTHKTWAPIGLRRVILYHTCRLKLSLNVTL